MTIRIQLKCEEKEVHADKVDLSVEGWVIADVTNPTVTKRRWIPKENVHQIRSKGNKGVVSPPSDYGKD